MSSDIDVSIIIPSYNAGDYLKKTLSSIKKNMTGQYEVFVIDDASPDDSAQMVTTEFPEVHLIMCEENQGIVAARHRGVERARGEFYFLIDSDVEILPGACEALMAEMSQDNQLGFVTCNKTSNDGSHQRSCFPMPTLWNSIQQMIPSIRKKIVENSEMKHQIASEPGWISPGHSLVRAKAWHDIGGQAKDFFFYGEEIDFCHRLSQKGWKIKFIPFAGFIHHGGMSQRGQTDRYRKLSWLGSIMIADRLWPLWQAIILRLLYLFRGIIVCFYKVFHGQSPIDLLMFLPKLLWPIPLRNNYLK